MLLVMMRDTTAEMVTRSETDPLSSVLNRRGFEHHGELALLRGSEAAVLVAADLDNFKQINDSFGHAAGDGVIAHFAAMLAEAAPASAKIGRAHAELQSLMRISYAVFCLKTKNNTQHTYALTLNITSSYTTTS